MYIKIIELNETNCTYIKLKLSEVKSTYIKIIEFNEIKCKYNKLLSLMKKNIRTLKLLS